MEFLKAIFVIGMVDVVIAFFTAYQLKTKDWRPLMWSFFVSIIIVNIISFIQKGHTY
jgi:hypothetical protein